MKEQWNNDNDLPNKTNIRKLIKQDLGINIDDITPEEVKFDIKPFKANKAPGPDRTIIELYKTWTIITSNYLSNYLTKVGK